MAVVGLAGGAPQVGAPVFGGGSTARAVRGSGVEYFHFTPSHEGSYAIASTAPGSAAAGEWLRFDVVSSSSSPEIVLAGQTYAVNVAGRRG